MIYELINPSDHITLEANDSLLAALCAIMLGDGQYGLYDEDMRAVVPIFGFTKPEKLIKWLDDHNIQPDKLPEFYVKNSLEMANILESLVYGSKTQRAELMESVSQMTRADQLDAIAKWNESQRASGNDISGKARTLAQTLRSHLVMQPLVAMSTPAGS